MRQYRRLLAWAFVMLAGALYAAWQMQVASWDFRNYHLYVPWAWMNGRLASDIAAAQVQTFFNPTLLLWLPWAALHLPAVVPVAALGAIQATNLLLLHAIARRAFPAPTWLAWLVALAGATAAMQLGEMGTTNGDNLVSIPLLAALALLVHRADAQPSAMRGALAIGVLLGLAAGLKLSNAPCALGGLVVALSASRSRPRAALAIAAGATVGFACAIVPWAIAQWRLWGDPLFPMLPRLFPSAVAFDHAPHDARFVPQTVDAWLLHPLAAAVDWRAVSEYRFRDLRLPLLWLAMATMLVVAAFRRVVVRDAFRGALPWLAGGSVALVAWLALFGYGRYIVPLEMLAPIAIALLWRRVLGARRDAWLATLLVLVVALTNPPNLGTIASRTQPLYQVALPRSVPLAGATVLVASGEPLAFVALALPADARVVRIESNVHGGRPDSGAFDAFVAREVARPAPRHVALFQSRSPATAPQRFAELGFAIDDSTCGRVESPLIPAREWPVWLCVAHPAR